MARLRQYEIDILMTKLTKLVNDYNNNILTEEELTAQADIYLHNKLPQLEDLAILEARYTETGQQIMELKAAIKIVAVAAGLSKTAYFNIKQYKIEAVKKIKKELEFKTIDRVEAQYQILNSDNNNLESIMDKIKEMFNL